MSADYLNARDAADALGVNLATLYAYVSRGLIRSETLGNSRAKRYRAEDIKALQQRKELRADPQKAGDEALHWGLPVLDSAITLIENGSFFYRGYPAVELARTRRAEEVASLIWTGGFELRFGELPKGLPSKRWHALHQATAGLSGLERMQALAPLVGSEDMASYDLRPEAIAQSGSRILRLLVGAVSEDYSFKRGLAATLQHAWTPELPEAERLVDATLILSADHELNVSAFAARCTASAGSPPFAAISAGLAALQGFKHGGSCDRVEALLAEVGSPARVREALARRLRRGETIPGFGHPLYPQGDPRTRALRELVRETLPDSADLELVDAVSAAAHELIGEHPNLDFGLVSVSAALRLPPGSAISLFALGRSIGWIGHAIEQYQSNRLIRPRARYVGPPPVDMRS